MILEALVQLSLNSCFLCAEPDCNTVSNDSVRCPRCYSPVISLAKILNPEPNPKEGSHLLRDQFAVKPVSTTNPVEQLLENIRKPNNGFLSPKDANQKAPEPFSGTGASLALTTPLLLS